MRIMVVAEKLEVGSQLVRRFLALERERLSAAFAVRVLGLSFDVVFDRVFAVFALAFVVDLVFGGAFAVRLLAFVVDLLFAGGSGHTKLRASQASPVPLASLSVCVGFVMPTQLS